MGEENHQQPQDLYVFSICSGESKRKQLGIWQIMMISGESLNIYSLQYKWSNVEELMKPGRILLTVLVGKLDLKHILDLKEWEPYSCHELMTVSRQTFLLEQVFLCTEVREHRGKAKRRSR